MATNLNVNQVEINGSVITENGYSIIGSFGDNARLEFYNVQINSASTQAKDLVKCRFYGVPIENKDFVNRPKILANMEVALSSPSNGCRILALKGLGGMGKTQLMLQYCYLHRAKYKFVFWLEVDSWSAAIDSFRNLAINLGLDKESAKEKNSEDELINWVRSWLQINTKWLLLLNNADDTMSNKVFKLLPRIGGDIILTTREPISPRMAIIIPVDKMQYEEALFLLFGVSSMGLIEQDARKLQYAREIITELDFMPLAIDLARAYLENTLTSFRKYLGMFKNMNERTELLEYRIKDNLSQYKHTVATVWQLSLERIRAENPIAVQILQACTFFHPENIPICLFKNQYHILEFILPCSGLPIPKQSRQQSWKTVGEAVAVLVKFSFVTRACLEAEDGVENPANDVLTIHRLVQKVIHETMDAERKLCWAYNLSMALNKDTHFSDSAIFVPRTRIIIDPYISHIRHFVTTLSQKIFISKDLSSLLDRVIWYLLEHGRYSDISELVQFSRLVSEATYGEEDVRILGSLTNHASFHRRLGKYVEAEPLYQRALAITEKAKGSEHPETTTSLNNLALLYNDWGKYDEADPLCKQALAIREKALGSEHPSIANSLNNLATLYDIRSKYDEAEPLYKRALAIREKALGLEHPSTADSLNNLAGLYFNRGKYDEAEPLYKRALAIRKKALGSEHPDTAHSLNNLSALCFVRGRYDEAELLYKRALAIREKALGSEHPDTAHSLNNLATLYFVRGKYGEAEPLHKWVLTIREKILGPEHPDTALSLNNIAEFYEMQGKYKEAEPLYKRALKIHEKALGTENVITASSLYGLATLCKSQGKYDAAELLYKRALAIDEKILGSEHPVTAMFLGALAGLFIHQGKYNEAETLNKRALAIREEGLNPMHPDTALMLNNLGNIYKSQGKFDDAEVPYQRALNIRKEMLGPTHPATASSMSSLGDLYVLQGKYGDAEPLCKLALAIREEKLGPMHPDTATSVSDMGNLYIRQGKYNDAEPLLQRALAIREQVLGSTHPNTVMSAKNLVGLRAMGDSRNRKSEHGDVSREFGFLFSCN